MTVRSQILSYFEEKKQKLILMFHRQCVVDQNDGRLLWTWLRKRYVQDQGTSPPTQPNVATSSIFNSFFRALKAL